MSTDIILHSTSTSELRDLIANVLKEELNIFFEKDKLDNRMLTRKQVCEMLGISLPTLHSWTKEGILKGIRIGNAIRYHAEDIKAAMQDIHSIKYSRFKG